MSTGSDDGKAIDSYSTRIGFREAVFVDDLGFFLNGKLVEFDSTHKIFTNPTDKRTEDYITGRFG